MNVPELNPPTAASAHHVEFFRLPAPGKRDPHFGLSRSWYYKAAALGEIKMIAIRQRGALRGVRLIAYDSVIAYVARCERGSQPANPVRSQPIQPTASAEPSQSCLALEMDVFRGRP